MAERIEGKVAKITSDRELIINKGTNDGVEVDMVFRVKGHPIDVPDPETGESLGKVSSIKVVVKVHEVDERFAIARTFRTRKVNVGGVGPTIGLNSIFQPPKYETRVETLRRNPRAGEPLAEEDSLVEVGDLVESVDSDDDFEDASTALWR